VLAHAVSEPLLDEDLETRAFTALKSSWPLPRHYMLYNLQGHPHEGIPFRWFQLFVEVDELTTVELILEELRAHGESPDYREDLTALLDVLHGCRDPELEVRRMGECGCVEKAPQSASRAEPGIADEIRPVPAGITVGVAVAIAGREGLTGHQAPVEVPRLQAAPAPLDVLDPLGHGDDDALIARVCDGSTVPSASAILFTNVWLHDVLQRVMNPVIPRICNSDGGRCRQLTSFNGPLTGTPRWSPDGRSIVFSRQGPSGDGSNPGDIFVMNPDGSELIQVTQTPEAENGAAWDPRPFRGHNGDDAE
jgi:hypothetical protein